MVEVYGRAGYAMLQTSRQVFWHKEGDSLSALWGDDGITEDNIADIGTKPLEPRRLGELRAKLPLRLPRGAGWLGAVAAARQIAAAEASRELAVRSSEVPATWYEIGMTWVCRFTLMIMIGLITVVWWQCRRGPSRPIARAPGRDQSVQTETTAKSNVASQAPTTYTAVRGCIQPRFLPLPEASHG